MAAIGNVSIIYLKSSDSLGNLYETNISKSFAVNPAATFQQMDTAARAVNALTTNTYNDTILVTNVSVNQTIMEESD